MEEKSSYLSSHHFPEREEELFQLGFTKDEVLSLLYLRQWYCSGGSDRIEVIRRFEFLKFLLERELILL